MESGDRPTSVSAMTFSIVARSADGRMHGVAVASKFLVVGSAVPAAEADIGALATQSYANLAYRPQGLMLSAHRHRAADVVAGLTAADPGRASRQLGVVGRAVTARRIPAASAILGRWPGRRRVRDPGQHPDRPGRRSRDGTGLAGRCRAAVSAPPGGGAGGRGRRPAVTVGGARAPRCTWSQGPGLRRHQRCGLPICGSTITGPLPELARLLDLHVALLRQARSGDRAGARRALADEVRAGLSALGHPATSPGWARRCPASGPAWPTWRSGWCPGAIDPLVCGVARRRRARRRIRFASQRPQRITEAASTRGSTVVVMAYLRPAYLNSGDQMAAGHSHLA